MDKYSNFINEAIFTNGEKEDEKKDEFAVKRLTDLVDMAIPLFHEASLIYPAIKKYKRTTKITNELSEAMVKTFSKPKPEAGDLIPGNVYIYTPDVDTRIEYTNAYNKQNVRLIEINKPGNFEYCDSKYIKGCIYLVEVKVMYGRSRRFWTRKHCLKTKKAY